MPYQRLLLNLNAHGIWDRTINRMDKWQNDRDGIVIPL